MPRGSKAKYSSKAKAVGMLAEENDMRGVSAKEAKKKTRGRKKTKRGRKPSVSVGRGKKTSKKMLKKKTRGRGRPASKTKKKVSKRGKRPVGRPRKVR